MKRHLHRRCSQPLIARPPRGRDERKIKPGTPYRGVIAKRVVEEIVDGFVVSREYARHATKGFRALRA